MGLAEQQSGTGILSRLDPRVKLAIVVAWSIVLALAGGFPGALAGLAGSLALVLLARPEKPGAFFLRLLSINAFLVFVWLVLPFSFSMPGRRLAGLGPLVLTWEGVLLSSRLTIQALGITAGAMAVTSCSTVFQLMAAARSLGAPEKLAAMLALMTRYVMVVRDEYERLVWAMRVRGFRARASLHCLRSYANLAGMLLVRGLDRGERVHAAMVCRGYRGRFYLALDRRLSRLDAVALAALAAAVARAALADACLGPWA
ncbi:MAG: cobalt ECF transporter T component CbiQ [Deltaproteobacteria bacterium]|jgi:cobalt/nickel transport system permease protein|nr:cobalt ECF transporter T component CbiQ [Deltaproteobacteria bacterium]